MKNIFLILSFIMSSSIVFSQDLIPGQIDFSGVMEFWKIYDIIKTDNEPSDEEWSRLLNTNYYNYFVKSDGEKEVKNRLLLAYLPSKDENRKSILSRNDYSARIINHLVMAPKNIELITRYIDSLKGVSIFDKAFELTKEYLPKNFIKKNKDLYPPVVFGVYEPDARANSKMIAIDIDFARTSDFNKFMAHEGHHFFISKIRYKTKDTEGGISSLLMFIRQLHLEGIADLIDKKHILHLPNDLKEQDDWYAYNYRKHYFNTKQTFKKVDSLLADSTNKNKLMKNGKLIWNSTHFGTHPEALHMSKLIEDTFGKKKILRILKNPFDIIWTYQKAALKNPERGHVFSKEAIKVLKKVEKEYLIRK